MEWSGCFDSLSADGIPPEFVRGLRERIHRKREPLLAASGPEYLVAGRR
jgi:hypothetical protein